VQTSDTYRISLPLFEGPFDLLLFFIERDELNIRDIPISQVTRDFLDYLHHAETMNMELASEFILVAATLMRIKAKMLLPRPDLDEQGDPIDPREELVQRLLAYKKYKAAVDELALLAESHSQKATRGYAKEEEKRFAQAILDGQEELATLDLYSLMRAFQRVWERHQDVLRKPRHVIRPYPYTVEEVKEELLFRLETEKRIDFVQLLIGRGERIYAVFAFLSILELFQLKKIQLTIGEGFNDFWVGKNAAI
jgi:segregation and condensation protein A